MIYFHLAGDKCVECVWLSERFSFFAVERQCAQFLLWPNAEVFSPVPILLHSNYSNLWAHTVCWTFEGRQQFADKTAHVNFVMPSQILQPYAYRNGDERKVALRLASEQCNCQPSTKAEIVPAQHTKYKEMKSKQNVTLALRCIASWHMCNVGERRRHPFQFDVNHSDSRSSFVSVVTGVGSEPLHKIIKYSRSHKMLLTYGVRM